MNHIQLYLNDQLADLSDDHPIALTFQINNLAEVQNQQGNTSNQFKLPLTQNNRQILGFPDDITFCTNTPYTQLQARYIANGIEVMPNAIAEIQQVDDNFANIVLLSGNVDFFDAIDGKLYDMGDSTTIYGAAKLWQQYDHPWTIDSIYYSQEKTDGWIWPIVDYGQISTTDFTQAINVRQMRPGFFLHTAIELLCKQAGYKANGPVLQNPLYQKLIVQFANDSFDHGTDYQNTINTDGFNTSSGMDQVYLKGSPASGNLHFNPGPNFPDGVNYTTTKNLKGTITLAFDCYMRGHPNDKNGSQVIISINLRDPNGNQNVASTTINFDPVNHQKVSGSGGSLIWEETFTKQKLSYDADLAPGTVININYQTRNSQGTYWIFKAGASLSFVPSNQNVLYTQQVQCERIFPDVSQKDLLKDTLQRFGIICQTDTNSKTINFASLKEIVNNIPNANDWTQKVVNQGKQVNYQLGNYSQKNWLRYKFDDSVTTDIMPQYFADDFITINDKTLNPGTPEQDLFVSIFAPSPNRTYYGGTIAQILKIDTNSDANAVDFSIGTEPRLLVDNKYDLRNAGPSGKTITLTDGVGGTRILNSIISTPYFYKSDGDFNLCWNDKALPGLRSTYYPELQKVLQQTKKIVRYLLLTPRDITELDLLTPIYLQQDGAYFYINKIDSWLKGQPCKVELVRLG